MTQEHKGNHNRVGRFDILSKRRVFLGHHILVIQKSEYANKTMLFTFLYTKSFPGTHSQCIDFFPHFKRNRCFGDDQSMSKKCALNLHRLWRFYSFVFSACLMISLRSYIKYSKECFIRYPNTLK